MPGKLDITGQKFGRLTAIRPYSKNKNGTVVWEFRCDCGNFMYKPVTKRNTDANVGCHACYLKHLSARTRVHGCSRITKEYRAWVHIKSRCYNPKVPAYAYYGARGVAMHPEWKESFEAFLSYIGHAPSKEHSVDRIDNSKGYEPGNVRWATRSEQANNKTTNAMYTINGVTKTLAMWCAEYGMDWDLVWSRINAHGFDVERALTEPKRNHNKFCGEKGERIGYRDYMFKGKVQNLKQWADEYKVSHKALQQKIKRGWHMESALMGGSNV